MISNIFGDFNRKKTVYDTRRGIKLSMNSPIKAYGSPNIERIIGSLIKVG
jgi:hypothetical protein